MYLVNILILWNVINWQRPLQSLELQFGFEELRVTRCE